jgi:predicted GNAT superfamily acetyltransferase
MTIRPLTNLLEFEQCVELQREAWGAADIDVIPVRMFVTYNRVGGLVLGAFEHGRLVGFVNAMPGVREGVPYWYSQMLAVAQGHWNAGTGYQLKLAQREHAIGRGIRLIEWTFDPLESKNAYLNICKLGVIVRRYLINAYGATSSRLQQGLESDRVIAEWWLDRPPVKLEDESEIRRLLIPRDIQGLKRRSLESAREMQLSVREHFLKNIDDDFFADGFERKDEWSEYLFVRGASRVDTAN